MPIAVIELEEIKVSQDSIERAVRCLSGTSAEFIPEFVLETARIIERMRIDGKARDAAGAGGQVHEESQ